MQCIEEGRPLRERNVDGGVQGVAVHGHEGKESEGRMYLYLSLMEITVGTTVIPNGTIRVDVKEEIRNLVRCPGKNRNLLMLETREVEQGKLKTRMCKVEL